MKKLIVATALVAVYLLGYSTFSEASVSQTAKSLADECTSSEKEECFNKLDVSRRDMVGYCVPSHITPYQLSLAFRGFVEWYPRYEDESADKVAKLAFDAAFPCIEEDDE